MCFPVTALFPTYAVAMPTSGHFDPSNGSHQEGSCPGTGFTGLTERHEVKLSTGTYLVKFYLAKNDVLLVVPGRPSFEVSLMGADNAAAVRTLTKKEAIIEGAWTEMFQIREGTLLLGSYEIFVAVRYGGKWTIHFEGNVGARQDTDDSYG